MSDVKIRALGVALEIIESTQLEVTYNYDDLIFVDKNLFIIQFDDENEKNLKLFFNNDIDLHMAGRLKKMLDKGAKQFNYTISENGFYLINDPGEKDEIQLQFIKKRKETKE